MRIFTEEQAQQLDAQTARLNLVNYSRIIESQSKQIQILFKSVQELQQLVLKQEESLLVGQDMINQLQALRFGRSSEKRSEDSPLFGLSDNTAAEKTANENQSKKKRKGHGRRAQPQLPVIEVIYNLSEQEIKNQGLKVFAGQYEMSEIITYQPPQVLIEKSLRQKYLGAPSKEGEPTIITAPGPVKLVEKSRYSIDFAIQSGLDKYESHLPLTRQVKRLAEFGLKVSAQSLYDHIDLISWYFRKNVVEPIRESILSSKIVQADETWWANLTDKKKFYLWAMTNERAVSFVIYNSRSQESAENFLSGFAGILLTDGYQCYKNITTAKHLANDWAHVRRKFIRAENSYPEESKWVVDKIRDLSQIEQKISSFPLTEKLKMRESESKPIVDEIYEWLLHHKDRILPSGSLGKAIDYTLNLWNGLNVFLKYPEVPMTTNLIERLQRDPVVGRKNHYGSKTIESAQVAADWYTVVGTCHINEVSPREYIKYALLEILAKREPLLPWDFKNKSENKIIDTVNN